MRPLFLICLLACAAAAPATKTAATTRPATTQAAAGPTPVAAIWFSGGLPLPDSPRDDWRQLIVGIWSDGTVVWSVADDGMGAPYQTTKLEPAAVEKLIRELDGIRFFTDAEVNHHRNRYPPDAGHTVLAAEAGPEKQQRLSLWREPPADRFGEVWTAARELILQVKPAEPGQPLGKVDESVFRLGRSVR